jgi:hypothetical protein
VGRFSKAPKLMRKVFGIVWEAVRRPQQWWRSRGKFRSVQVKELAAALQKGHLYLIGSGKPWSAAMVCPCGCGETIHISLLHMTPQAGLSVPTTTDLVRRVCRSSYLSFSARRLCRRSRGRRNARAISADRGAPTHPVSSRTGITKIEGPFARAIPGCARNTPKASRKKHGIEIQPAELRRKSPRSWSVARKKQALLARER